MRVKIAALLCVSILACGAVAIAESERGSAAWLTETWANAREYEKNSQIEEALAAYQELTDYGREISTKLESSRARIRIYLADKRYEEAAQVHADAANKIADKSTADQIVDAYTVAKVDLQPLANAISKLYAAKTGYPFTRLLLAKLYYVMKMDDKARPLIAQVYPEVVSDPTQLRMLVYAIANDRSLDKWRLEITRYLVKQAPNDIPCAQAHADACASNNLRTECVQEAYRIMRQRSGDFVDLVNAAGSCSKAKAADDAVVIYRQALDVADGIALKTSVLWSIGQTYAFADRKTEAIEAFKKVISDGTDATFKKLAEEAIARLSK